VSDFVFEQSILFLSGVTIRSHDGRFYLILVNSMGSISACFSVALRVACQRNDLGG